MAQVLDKNLGILLNHDHALRLVASDPATAKQGTLILNTTDNKIKIYYTSQWQVLHTLIGLTPGASGSPMGLLLVLTYP